MPPPNRTPPHGWIAPTAVVLGDVHLCPGVNIWYSAVVRGDVAPITLGESVNLQDGVIVHCVYDVPQVIDDRVVVGHAVVIHGRRIRRDTLVGIGAIVLSGCDVGEECVIAAGAVVPPNSIIPARSMVVGVPGKVVRGVTDEEVERTRSICRRYRELAERYASGAAT
jgi:carbonic anhydrase/acetyltransferase-like protein (isoleucine patch superfamily)